MDRTNSVYAYTTTNKGEHGLFGIKGVHRSLSVTEAKREITSDLKYNGAWKGVPWTVINENAWKKVSEKDDTTVLTLARIHRIAYNNAPTSNIVDKVTWLINYVLDEKDELLKSYFEFECEMFRLSKMLPGFMGVDSGLAQPIYSDMDKHKKHILAHCRMTTQNYNDMFDYPEDVKALFKRH